MRSLQPLITLALAFIILSATLPCGVRAQTANPRNQVVIAGLGDPGALAVLEYQDGSFKTIWSTVTSDVESSRGAKIGDFNNDGVNEFLITRRLKNADGAEKETVVEAWGYDRNTGTWQLIVRQSVGRGPYSGLTYVSAIGDFDHDGRNEILVTNGVEGAFEVWGNKQKGARTIEKLATIRQCALNRTDPTYKTTGEDAMYIKTAADLNGNGVPEIMTHCREQLPFDFSATPRSTIMMYEYQNGAYRNVGSVASPIHIIDDSSSGDLDGDGRPEIVLCGNSSTSHVLAFHNGAYRIDYTAPRILGDIRGFTFTQACSVGDLTNDGKAEWADFGGGPVRIFTHQYNGYAPLWQGTWTDNPNATGLVLIGTSAIGDIDNDGHNELLLGTPGGTGRGGVRLSGGVKIWKRKDATAATFENTTTIPSTTSIEAIAVGPLK